MKKKKKQTELEKILSSISSIVQGKKEDFGELSKQDNPNSILRLISKYEKLAAKLKSSGSGDELDKILVKISKLKMILSNLYKKKRQKMLELHWEQIREENDKSLKKLHQQQSSKNTLTKK
ncbi:MAG TPA: hypothetical protein DEG23_01435 [Coxiellaceae bacterium]|nr:MAG: hypothetical protein A2V89_01895 [Gammaproteobacteria bacterium RBG_16_37_9]HBY55466.1 hypothetical protein [Coxiellaceae bacterium]